MIWKKDRLRPTQPYLVFDTKNFYQEIYLRQGISHFYSCEFIENQPLRVVPDGCIDLFFEYDREGKMQGYVCGTPLTYEIQERHGMKEVFGIRFMPGNRPELIGCSMRDVLNKKIPIEAELTGDPGWLKELEQETDFYQRIRIFLEAYTKAEKRKIPPFGKAELVESVKQLVYRSDGKIRVSMLQEATGYSERYINRVFIEEMGFSPKAFCKIIQFQRALEFLNYGAPDKMTDAAMFLGYYDQAQFIHDFSRYAGITPKQYLKMAENLHYKNRITEIN